jgi:hypothetical protein
MQREASGCTLQCKQEIREELRSSGFVYVPARDFLTSPELEKFWFRLRDSYVELPADPHDQSGTRYRRYGKFHRLPGSEDFRPYRPIDGMTAYLQDGNLNPDHDGNVRWFASLTEAQAGNPFLSALIKFDICQLPILEGWSQVVIQAGVHPIRILARPGRPGMSSPDQLHRDGERFTFIHLVELADVEGGLSTVATNDRVLEIDRLPELVAMANLEIRLINPLDTLIVSDALVWHHVGAITVKPGYREGWRSVLLIDFVPLLPDLTKNS